MIKKIIERIGVDGLLHLLASGFIVLAVLTLTCSIKAAIITTIVVGIGKEIIDIFIQRDNTWKQAAHDFLCDIAGIAVALIIYFTQILIY